MPESLGSVTRLVFYEEPEPGKIHVEFEASALVQAGRQVKMDGVGKIVGIVAAEPKMNVIGVSVHDIAANERGTIATKGYCIVIGRAGAALVSGPVQSGTYDVTNNRPLFAVGATDAVTLGWNLTPVAAAGEIRVLLN